MAIVVQHGESGALAAAAAAAGRTQDFWRRFEAEQQLVGQARQQQMQQRQAAEQARQQSEALRAAMQRQQRTPTAPVGQGRAAGPMAEHVARRAPHELPAPNQGRVPLFRQQQAPGHAEITGTRAVPAAGGVATAQETFRMSPDGEITGTVGGTEMTPEQIQQRGGFVQSVQEPMGTPAQAAKIGYMQSRLADANLPQHMQAALTELAMAEDVTWAQFISQVEAAYERTNAGPGSEFSTAQQLSAQRRILSRDVADAEAKLAEFRSQSARIAPFDDTVPDEALSPADLPLRRQYRLLQQQAQQAREAMDRLDAQVAGWNTSPAPRAPGQPERVINPTTGQQLEWRNGQWQPVDGDRRDPPPDEDPARRTPPPLPVPPERRAASRLKPPPPAPPVADRFRHLFPNPDFAPR
jgi:hypothetical protein